MAWNDGGNGKDPWDKGGNEPPELDKIVQDGSASCQES